MLKKLKADGWLIVRTTGSHRQLHHDTKLGTVTVNGHPGDDIGQNDLKSIERQAGWRQ